jgi:hypothetical protein
VNAVGKNGVFVSTNLKAYKKGFEEVGRKLTADTDGRYVFSYCSPKRKGNHKVEVEAVTPKDRGRVMFKFNADGFTAGCTPKTKPDLAPAAPANAKKGEETAEAEDES